MNVSSQPIVLPSTHQRRRFIPTKHNSTYLETSPIGVSNKIKAIQSRRTRLNPITNNVGYTNVRPLNFGYTTSKEKISVLTAEKLCDRNKDFRLDRIPTRQTPAHRPSIYSTATLNQQIPLWSNYPTSITTTAAANKQLQTNLNSPTITPPSHPSIKNKSTGGKMPEISRRQTRPILANRQNLPLPIIDTHERTCIPSQKPDENDDDNDNDIELVMDKEFEEYFEKAIVKCADWLLKYVFINENK